MLFGKLGQLNQLGHDVLLVVAVGAVDQRAGDGIQDGLIPRLLTQGKEERDCYYNLEHDDKNPHSRR